MKKFLTLSNAELSTKNYWGVLVFFCLILSLYYGDTINNSYNLDDQVIYTENSKAIHGLENIKEIFTKSSFSYQDSEYGYRPVALLSFAIENHLFGIDSTVSHAINLILYLLAVFVFFKVVVVLLPNEKAKFSLLTALLFLILPIHSEVVNNVKCRDELLMLLFGLLATFYWIKSIENPYKILLSIFFLYISILSKKSAFIFLGIIPFISHFSESGNWKKGLRTLLLMTIPVILFRLTIKFLKSGKGSRDYSGFENPIYEAELLFNKTVMVLESTWFYLKSMLFPTQLVSYYGLNTIEINVFGIGSVLAIIFTLLLIYLAIKGLASKQTYSLGAIIILGGILPFVNLIMPMVGIVAERFVTIASLGLCLMLVFGLKDVLVKRNKINYGLIAFVIYAIAYLPVIKARNAEWRTEVGLLEADVAKEPDSFQLNYMMASNYFFQLPEMKDPNRRAVVAKKSLDYYNKTLALIPAKEAYNEKGTLLYKVFQNEQEAEKSYLDALALDPNYEIVYYNLGSMYHDFEQTDKSIKNLVEFVKRDQSNLNAYYLLTKQLAQTKQFQEALKWANSSLRHHPKNAELTINKANIFYSAGDVSNALALYSKVLKELDSNNITAKEMVKRLKVQNPE